MRSYIAEEIHWIAPASVMFQELHWIGVGLCRYRAREREVELWHLCIRMIEVGADRFRIPDIMFNPSLLQTIPGMEKFGAEANAPLQGLPQMVIDSINKCDVDIRRELFSSIMVS
jgi:hypothetical protein